VTSLGFRTDLDLLRRGGSEITDCGDHLIVRTAGNPDFWWGNFLLLATPPGPDDAQGWLDTFARTFPLAAHRAFGVDAMRGTVEDLRPFTDLGLDGEAASVLTATGVHPPARTTQRVECRALRGDDDWARSAALELRSVDDPAAGPQFDEFVHARTRTSRRLVESGHGAWFGAFLDGRLVCQLGLLRAGAGLARFQSVLTDPAFRRLGVAATLVHHACRWGLDVLQVGTLVMVADPDYFAVELYRKLGFVDEQTQLRIQGAS
jgi:GNAT superfamily N-acetyltransferase